MVIRYVIFHATSKLSPRAEMMPSDTEQSCKTDASTRLEETKVRARSRANQSVPQPSALGGIGCKDNSVYQYGVTEDHLFI